MNYFARLLGLALLGALLGVPYFAMRQGWGIGSERDPARNGISMAVCSEEGSATVLPICRKTLRSPWSRWFRGGSFRYGK